MKASSPCWRLKFHQGGESEMRIFFFPEHWEMRAGFGFSLGFEITLSAPVAPWQEWYLPEDSREVLCVVRVARGEFWVCLSG